MNDFKKGGFRKGGSFGGRPKFGGDRKFGGKFGGRDRGDEGGRPELFPAVCADCGKHCEVPFRPNGIRPVYCRDCFGNHDEGSDRRESRPDTRFGREQRPQFVRSVTGGDHDGGNEEIKRQLAYFEKKLDRILEILVRQEKPRAESTPKKDAPEKSPVSALAEASEEKSAKPAAKKAAKAKPAAKSAAKKAAPAKKAKTAKK